MMKNPSLAKKYLLADLEMKVGDKRMAEFEDQLNNQKKLMSQLRQLTKRSNINTEQTHSPDDIGYESYAEELTPGNYRTNICIDDDDLPDVNIDLTKDRIELPGQKEVSKLIKKGGSTLMLHSGGQKNKDMIADYKKVISEMSSTQQRPALKSSKVGLPSSPMYKKLAQLEGSPTGATKTVQFFPQAGSNQTYVGLSSEDLRWTASTTNLVKVKSHSLHQIREWTQEDTLDAAAMTTPKAASVRPPPGAQRYIQRQLNAPAAAPAANSTLPITRPTPNQPALKHKTIEFDLAHGGKRLQLSPMQLIIDEPKLQTAVRSTESNVFSMRADAQSRDQKPPIHMGMSQQMELLIKQSPSGSLNAAQRAPPRPGAQPIRLTQSPPAPSLAANQRPEPKRANQTRSPPRLNDDWPDGRRAANLTNNRKLKLTAAEVLMRLGPAPRGHYAVNIRVGEPGDVSKVNKPQPTLVVRPTYNPGQHFVQPLYRSANVID